MRPNCLENGRRNESVLFQTTKRPSFRLGTLYSLGAECCRHGAYLCVWRFWYRCSLVNSSHLSSVRKLSNALLISLPGYCAAVESCGYLQHACDLLCAPVASLYREASHTVRHSLGAFHLHSPYIRCSITSGPLVCRTSTDSVSQTHSVSTHHRLLTTTANGNIKLGI